MASANDAYGQLSQLGPWQAVAAAAAAAAASEMSRGLEVPLEVHSEVHWPNNSLADNGSFRCADQLAAFRRSDHATGQAEVDEYAVSSLADSAAALVAARGVLFGNVDQAPRR